MGDHFYSTTLITNTVSRLPTALVVPLVDALVARLGRGKRGYGAGVGGASSHRAKALIEWLRAVLVIYTSYLISVRF